MIDLFVETPMSIEEARKHRLLRGRNGNAPDFGTVARWIKNGVRGVKLEHVTKPSGLHTTEEAIVRFIERLSMPTPQTTAPTPRELEKARAKAKAYLDKMGI